VAIPASSTATGAEVVASVAMPSAATTAVSAGAAAVEASPVASVGAAPSLSLAACVGETDTEPSIPGSAAAGGGSSFPQQAASNKQVSSSKPRRRCHMGRASKRKARGLAFGQSFILFSSSYDHFALAINRLRQLFSGIVFFFWPRTGGTLAISTDLLPP